MDHMMAPSPLRQWRIGADLTLDDLEDLTGISKAMWSRVERGERTMAPLTRVRVARRLGVRVRDLFPVEGNLPDAS